MSSRQTPQEKQATSYEQYSFELGPEHMLTEKPYQPVNRAQLEVCSQVVLERNGIAPNDAEARMEAHPIIGPQKVALHNVLYKCDPSRQLAEDAYSAFYPHSDAGDAEIGQVEKIVSLVPRILQSEAIERGHTNLQQPSLFGDIDG